MTFAFERQAELQEKIDALVHEEGETRDFLWNLCPHWGKYGDDGEMQCNMWSRTGPADFKRDPLPKLRAHVLAAIQMDYLHDEARLIDLARTRRFAVAEIVKLLQERLTMWEKERKVTINRAHALHIDSKISELGIIIKMLKGSI